MAKNKLGSSKVQNQLENEVYNKFVESNGYKKITESISLPDFDIQPDINCMSGTKRIVGEIFIRVGDLKSGQKRKIASDILKLISYRKSLEFNHNESIDLVLLLEKDLWNKLNASDSWLKKAIGLWNINVKPYELTGEELKSLEVTIDNQAIGNSKK